MQDRVDLSDRSVIPVHFLRKITSAGRVLAVLAEKVGRMHQHTARAARRIIDCIAGMRLEDAHECVHNFRRREEFASLGAGIVGELLDQVLVGAAQQVRRDVLVREVVPVKVLDERVDHLVRDKRLARAVRSGLVPIHCEDTAQFVVGICHGAHGFGENLANINRNCLDVTPTGSIWNLEAVVATFCGKRPFPSR